VVSRLVVLALVGRAKRVSSFPTAPHLAIYKQPYSQCRVGGICSQKERILKKDLPERMLGGKRYSERGAPISVRPNRPDPATPYRNPLVSDGGTCAQCSLFWLFESANSGGLAPQIGAYLGTACVWCAFWPRQNAETKALRWHK